MIPSLFKTTHPSTSLFPILIIFFFSLLLQHATSWCEISQIRESSAVTCVDYSFDQKYLATTTSTHVTIWDGVTKNKIKTYAVSNARCARFSRKASTNVIAISDSSSNVYVKNLATDATATISAGHGSGTVYLEYTPTDSKLMTCGGTNGKVRTWSVGSSYSMSDDESVSQVNNCAYNSDGSRFGASASNNKLYYEPFTGGGGTSSNTNNCFDVDIKPDNSRMVAACPNGVIYTTSNGATSTISSGSSPLTVAYAEDSETFAVGGNDQKVYIHNGTSNNNTMMQMFLVYSNVKDLDFSDDGSFLIAGTASGRVYEYAKYCQSCNPGYWHDYSTDRCTLCWDSLKGCGLCSDASTCVECVEGYLINRGTGQCETCPSLIPGCLTCYNTSICTSCLPGYFLNSSSNLCENCSSYLVGCTICNSSDFCLECTNDFYLDKTTDISSHTCQICEGLITHCIKCYQNPSNLGTYKCMECEMGFYENSGACTACSSNCYSCQSATNCSACLTGYYPSGTGCSRCTMTGCIKCDNSNNCIQCDDEYFLTTSKVCSKCTNPCLSCRGSASNCTSCMNGYFFPADGTGVCTLCSYPCISCNDSSSCLTCAPMYFLEWSNLTCRTCQDLYPNCQECTNTTCLMCMEGYYSDGTDCLACMLQMYGCVECTSAINCNICAGGTYLISGIDNANSSCEICPLGCSTCYSSTSCTNCHVGYYLSVNTCLLCDTQCISCTGTGVCLQCEQGYALSTGGSCVSCVSQLSDPGCLACGINSTDDTLHCLDCEYKLYLDVGTGLCEMCPDNCTTCINGSFCDGCEFGMYADEGICLPCSYECSACVENSTDCVSCNVGYYLSDSNTCSPCSDINCATCSSTSPHECLTCSFGFYLSPITTPQVTTICESCLAAISSCHVCEYSVSTLECVQCSYGYALAANKLSCSPCSAVEGCKHCTKLNSCENCEIGYYMTIVGIRGVCVACDQGCKDCSSANVCNKCVAGYYLKDMGGGVHQCLYCESSPLLGSGCRYCSSQATCTKCFPEFYLNLTTQSCQLCSSSIFSCLYCNSSTICLHCQDGFYLFNDACVECDTAIDGCEMCNSSSVCLSCEFGMYLKDGICERCVVGLPGCLYCLDEDTCRQCDSGWHLQGVQCLFCESSMTGCMLCESSTDCLQCKGGFYLDTSTPGSAICTPCSQQGCELCLESSPSQCLKCNSRYYLNSTLGTDTCIKCRSEPLLTGCLECNSNSYCTVCDPGYYVSVVGGNRVCALCADNIEGCGRCISAGVCEECKGTYYLKSDGSCEECKQTLIGCSFCNNASQCLSCYHGYYLTLGNQCLPCPSVPGCLSCINETYCQYCEPDYFLEPTNSVCYPCSVMEGCYACVDNLTCSICKGGYIRSKDTELCLVMRVQAFEEVTQLKFITKYVNDKRLGHYLYAKGGLSFKKSDVEWESNVKIVLEDDKYEQLTLEIIDVEWYSGNSYTLIFYTNNPIDYDEIYSPFPFINNSRRRRLASNLETNFRTNIEMNQEAINKILPDLFLNKDLNMGYDVDSAEFSMSYAKHKGGYDKFSYFGIIICLLFFLQYMVKGLRTVPNSPELAEILPHVLALKAPGFLIFPTYMEFVYFCYGFMVFELPWLNEPLGLKLANHSDYTPQTYSLFYYSLQLGCTYLIPLVIILSLGFILLIYYRSREDDLYKERFPLGYILYNTAMYGLVSVGVMSIEGALLNPIDGVSVNSVFYMLGIATYSLVFAYTIYSMYLDRKNFYKCRVLIKATLLTFANVSPVYLFCSAVLIDFVCIVIDYFVVKRQFYKFWVWKNVLLNVALTILAFIPSSKLGLILTAAIVVIVLVMDIITHIREYRENNRQKKFKALDKSQLSEGEINIWNINFDKEGVDLEEKGKRNDLERRKRVGKMDEFGETQATSFGNNFNVSQDNFEKLPRRAKVKKEKRLQKEQKEGDRQGDGFHGSRVKNENGFGFMQ